MSLIITLILVGLVLVLAEILLIPGVGVAGILGLLAMGGSCYYAFYEFGNLVGGIITGINALLVVALIVFVLKANTWKRMSLETSIDSKAVDDGGAYVSVGDVGLAVTRLAPMGSVRFGDKVVEVKVLEGIINPGSKVEVVMIEAGRICVSAYSEENNN